MDASIEHTLKVTEKHVLRMVKPPTFPVVRVTDGKAQYVKPEAKEFKLDIEKDVQKTIDTNFDKLNIDLSEFLEEHRELIEMDPKELLQKACSTNDEVMDF